MANVIRSGATYHLGSYGQLTRVESNGTSTVVIQFDGHEFSATILDEDGNADFPVTLSTTDTPDPGTIVQIASHGFDFVVREDGKFILAWTEEVVTTFEAGNGSTVSRVETQVVHRLYNADGTAGGEKVIVATTPDTFNYFGNATTKTDERSVAIAQRPDGTLVTTWTRSLYVEDPDHPGFADADASDPADVWYRLSDEDGNPLGSPSQFNNRDGGYNAVGEDYATVTGLDNHGFAMVWRSDLPLDASLRLRTADAEGALGNEVSILTLRDVNTRIFSEREYSVHAIQGGFVLAVAGIKHTLDQNTGEVDPSLNEEVIRLYTFDNDGALRGGDFFELSRPAIVEGNVDNGNYGGLDIEKIDGGGYVVTWVGPVANGSQSYLRALYAQVFDANGGALGEAVTILDLPGEIAGFPLEHYVADAELVAQADGSFLVVANVAGAFGALAEMVLQRITLETGGHPQAAPTEVSLTQVLTQLAENTEISTARKIADITVKDDAQGVNELTLLGSDASFFEIIGNAVYLKAGTVLDFETKSIYQVSVAVNDAGVKGRSPDAVSQEIMLTITDINPEPIIGDSGDNILTGSELPDHIYGRAGHDILSGNGGDDYLYGEEGDDTLNGGTGADFLYGGTGNDTYIVDNANDRTFESANEGTDTVRASRSWTLDINIENLVLIGSAITGTGNSLANTITGTNASNTLDGKGGADRMAGGLGNDTYIVDNTKDKVTEYAKEGTDLVKASVSYTLASNVENLTLTGSGKISGTGNTLANVITGNSANNTLDGKAGADKLIGGAGNDRLIGGSGGEKDKLYGGSGADTFVFTSAQGSSAVKRGDLDTIYDFSRKQGDEINLKSIDANTKTKADNAFSFIQTDKFHKKPGELRYEIKNGDTFIYGDTNGDGVADFAIRLDLSLALKSSDFIL